MKIKYDNGILNYKLASFNGKNITVELEALLQAFNTYLIKEIKRKTNGQEHH